MKFLEKYQLLIILLTLTILFFAFTNTSASQPAKYNKDKLYDEYENLIDTYYTKSKNITENFIYDNLIDTYKDKGIDGIIVEAILNDEKDKISFEKYTDTYQIVSKYVLMVVNVEKLSLLSNDPKISFITKPGKFKLDGNPSPSFSYMGGMLGNIDGRTGDLLKIAIIDPSWNNCKNNLNGDELPNINKVTMIDPTPLGIFGGDGKSAHGTACLEIIYDFLPNAYYYLYDADGGGILPNWWGNVLSCFKHIKNNYFNEIDVISCSMAMIRPVDPENGFGDELTSVINELTNLGIVCFFSSGNYSENHIYFENITTNNIPDIQLNSSKYFFVDSDKDYIQFEGKTRINYVDVDRQLRLIVSWNDYYNNYNLDFALELYEMSDNSEIWKKSSTRIDGNSKPFEELSYLCDKNKNYRLKLKLVNPQSLPTNFWLDVNSYGSLNFNNSNRYLREYNSITYPAYLENVISVGAINVSEKKENYSSCGSNNRPFLKPDFVAISGGTSWSYQNQAFNGTSASCPSLVGLAGQVIQQQNIPRNSTRKSLLVNGLKSISKSISPMDLPIYSFWESQYLSNQNGDGNFQFGYGIPIKKRESTSNYSDNYEPDDLNNQSKTLNINLVTNNNQFSTQIANYCIQLRTIHNNNDVDWIELQKNFMYYDEGNLFWFNVSTINNEQLLAELYHEKIDGTLEFLYSNTTWELNTQMQYWQNDFLTSQIVGQTKYPIVFPIPFNNKFEGKLKVKIKRKITSSTPIYYYVSLSCQNHAYNTYGNSFVDFDFSNNFIKATLKSPFKENNDGLALIKVKDNSNNLIQLFTNPYLDNFGDPNHEVIKGIKIPFSSSNPNLQVTTITFTGQEQTIPYPVLANISNVELDKTSYLPNQSATITVTLANSLTGATVNFTVGSSSPYTCTEVGNGVYRKTFYAPSFTGTYDVIVSASKANYISNTKQTTISVTNAQAGHDYKINYFAVDKQNVKPGRSVKLTGVVKNNGIYPETNVPVTFRLLDPQGGVVGEQTFNISLQPAGIEQKEVTFTTSSAGPTGYYTAEVRSKLGNDFDVSNDYASTSVYVGDTPTYEQYKVDYLGILYRNSIFYANGYEHTVTSIGTLNGREAAKVKIKKDSYSFEQFCVIDSVTKYDNGNYVLIYHGEISSNEALFDYGVAATSINITPSELFVDAGEIGYYSVATNNSDSYFGGNGFGSDMAVVFPWLKKDIEGKNFDIKVTIPLTATRRTYTYWLSIESINGTYIQKVKLIVTEPHNITAISINPTNGSQDTIPKMINIKGVFKNSGGYDEPNVNIKLEITGPNNYSYIENSQMNLPKGTQDTAKYFWNTMGRIPGSYQIKLTGIISGDKYNDHTLISTVTLVNPPVPSKPLLLSPSNRGESVSILPTLSWGAIQNINSYQLQVAIDTTFSNIILNDSALINDSKTIGPLQNKKKYFWRVRAKNSSGYGPFSDIWSFTTIVGLPSIPHLTYPPNDTTDLPTSITLTWTPSADAATYRVQVSKSITFNSTIFDDSTITGSSKQVSPLDKNTMYYWRVRAKNIAGLSSWSAANQFKTYADISYPGEYQTDSNTVLLLHLNEINGDFVWDASGGNNNGIAFGATPGVAGMFGKARYFDGIDDYLSINNSAILNIENNITVEARIFIDTIPLGARYYILAKGNSYNLWVDRDDWGIFLVGGVSASMIIGWNGLSSGRWHHVGMAYNGNYIQLYRDGETLNSTGNILAVIDSSAPLIIGSYLGAQSFFHGKIDEVRISSTARALTDVNYKDENIPQNIALYQNYPNPFNPTTNIEFSIPSVSHVSVTVYNMLGQEISNLVSENLNPGVFKITWDGKGTNGNQAPSGMYFYRIIATPNNGGEPYIETRKMLLLK